MKVERELQRALLEYLRQYYPKAAFLNEAPGHDTQDFMGNLFYLHEHGLIQPQAMRNTTNPEIITATITAKGLDFLEDDGGVGAILSTVSVKIDKNNLRDLLEINISSANISDKDKSALKTAIKNAPSTVLTETLRKLVGLALDRGPDAARLIQNIFLGPS